MVESIIENASARLDLVRETFPTYTLHNHTHALNVVRLMGELLGSKVNELRPLEGAFLLLSAYLHDIGMVFTEDERSQLPSEPDFGAFLTRHPDAFVELEKAGSLTDNVAEWYCRWIHPKRVHLYLASLSSEAVAWGIVPLDRHLGLVCESHGGDTGSILTNIDIDSDFISEADLKFCAIILRLADILDFDRTRSPDELYRYLGLERRSTKRTSASDVEWRKHLFSDGFRLPNIEARDEAYSLHFVAAPDHPAVEHDIRSFLDTIEAELASCESLIRHCSDRWRSFILPHRVQRKDIISKGYKYGEFRFGLEQDQILDLLMGENLYSDPYVFVRELIQNAIDASRHRVYYEHQSGNTGYTASPIHVTGWIDYDGYQWVRIDDRGMGMSEELILKYLLKVGQSYYRSADFQAEVLRYKARQGAEFTPISRFGIGMLSCFIVGDRVEISTKRVADQPYNACALRLSMAGLRSFYTLYAEPLNHRAPEMPNDERKDERYRRGGDYGTSIAVRLDPRKERGRLDLTSAVARYVVCSPIPVYVDGVPVGGDHQELIQTPWLPTPLSETLRPDEVRTIEDVMGFRLSAPPLVRLVPISLADYSPDSNLQGQAVVGFLEFTGSDNNKIGNSGGESRSATLKLNAKGELNISLSYSHHDKARSLEAKQSELAFKREELEPTLRDIERNLEAKQSDEAYRVRHIVRDLRYQVENFRQDGSRKSLLYLLDEIDYVARRDKNLAPEAEAVKQIIKDVHTLASTEKRLVREARRDQKIDVTRIFETLPAEARERLLKKLVGNVHWFSHNGIYVPTKGNSREFEIKPSFANGWVKCSVALQDAMRPNVSLSRDELKALPWNFYSSLTLAFSRALCAAGVDQIPGFTRDVCTTVLGASQYLLGTLLDEPNIELADNWSDEPIINTDKGMMSLHEAEKALSLGQSFKLNDIPSSLGSSWQSGYLSCCQAALIQIGLRIKYKGGGWSGEYVVEEQGKPIIREGEKLFPPLFFMFYDNSKVLRDRDRALNSSHPLSDWLITAACQLREKSPGVLESLRTQLSKRTYYSSDDKNKVIEAVNAALERLRSGPADLRPPVGLELTENDFS